MDFPYGNMGFPGGSDSKESACNEGDPSSIPGLGRSSGEGNGNPLQYSCLDNSMDRGAWWTIVLGVAKSWTGLSDIYCFRSIFPAHSEVLPIVSYSAQPHAILHFIILFPVFVFSAQMIVSLMGNDLARS